MEWLKKLLGIESPSIEWTKFGALHLLDKREYTFIDGEQGNFYRLVLVGDTLTLVKITSETSNEIELPTKVFTEMFGMYARMDALGSRELVD